MGNNAIIVADKGWASSIPDWILKAIAEERKKNPDAVSDYEICAFLFTASLKSPMNEDFVYIYSYVVAKCMTDCCIKPKNLPVFLKAYYKKGLTKSQKILLEGIREKIKNARMKRIVYIRSPRIVRKREKG